MLAATGKVGLYSLIGGKKHMIENYSVAKNALPPPIGFALISVRVNLMVKEADFSEKSALFQTTGHLGAYRHFCKLFLLKTLSDRVKVGLFSADTKEPNF